MILASAVDLRNTTCTNSPCDYELDISTDYHTSQLFGYGADIYDTDASNYTWYDLYMKRTVPFVVSVISDGQEAETPQVVCLSADDIANGSREPDKGVDVGEGTGNSDGQGGGDGNGGDGQSTGVSVDWKAKGWMASGMAGVAGLSLLL
jgi:hypothetical protein